MIIISIFGLIAIISILGFIDMNKQLKKIVEKLDN
jgi:uncharacterized protein YybS (DUF2232 family)